MKSDTTHSGIIPISKEIIIIIKKEIKTLQEKRWMFTQVNHVHGRGHHKQQ